MDDIEALVSRKKEAAAKLRRIEDIKNKNRKALAECFSTDAGKTTLKWLMNECGYQQPSVIYDSKSGEIRVEATVYNEAKRDIYLRLRSLLSSRPDILMEVEIQQRGES